ncbi:H-type lectin domain-containing protein [Profundibacterium mesophilum]|nr:H-type lectin domain-containing protein [Profundibacterium mesophilum]
MKRLNRNSIGIDQGADILFSDFEEGGPMWAGQGPRQVRRHVRFSEGFASPPSIQVGMSMWDLDQQTNARADIAAEDVTATGFVIVFRTWGDTRIARVRASWLAIGDLPDDDWDHWDLG